MLSLPHEFTPTLVSHKEDMLRFLGEHFATLTAGPTAGPFVGPVFGWIVGLVFGVLLLSAVNTAIIAVVGVIYLMAPDGEFPRPVTKLNRHARCRLPDARRHTPALDGPFAQRQRHRAGRARFAGGHPAHHPRLTRLILCPAVRADRGQVFAAMFSTAC